MWTMRPHFRDCMPGMTRRERRTTFISVVSTPRRHCSSVSFMKGAAGGPPVLVTRMSTWPKRDMVVSNQRWRSLAFVTSQATASTSAPRAVISSRAGVSDSSEREQMERRQPSRASAMAMARPRPFDEAATMATRWVSCKSMVRSLRQKAEGRSGLRARLLRVQETVRPRCHSAERGKCSRQGALLPSASAFCLLPSAFCLLPSGLTMRLRKTLGGGSMRRFLTLALLVAAALPLAADEGMWLFNAPPRAALKQRYGFEPTQAWLDHLQKASVRFHNHGPGPFPSDA